ncbi:hypothetical protein CI105_04620 [Candidatus Izimaplasma bacterium ZiA1]|nr:hypothetical protein CI105_04620 [Candidatus Izimaplasma bacterium ZiA1]
MMESFFSKFKKEEIYRHIYNEYDHLKAAIDEYMIFYNTVRPHGAIKNMTPDEYDALGLIKAKEKPSS